MYLADATALPFPGNHFDLIFSSAVLHHIKNWQKVIAEVDRVLKPGGKFLLSEAYQPAFKNPLVRWFDKPEAVIDFKEMQKELDLHNLPIIFQQGNEDSSYIRLIVEKK